MDTSSVPAVADDNVNAVFSAAVTMVVVEDDLIAVGDGGIVARSTGSSATWAIALNGVSVENLRDVLFLTSGIVLAVGANETIGSTNAGVTWTLQNSAGGHLEKLAYNRRECHRSAAGVILLSRDQPTIADPFPEQVAAVLLLVGYAVYALNRPL